MSKKPTTLKEEASAGVAGEAKQKVPIDLAADIYPLARFTVNVCAETFNFLPKTFRNQGFFREEDPPKSMVAMHAKAHESCRTRLVEADFRMKVGITHRQALDVGDLLVNNSYPAVLEDDQAYLITETLHVAEVNQEHTIQKLAYHCVLMGPVQEPDSGSLFCYHSAFERSNNLFETCPFSERQLQILQQLAQGKSTQAISEILFISVDTVRTHRQHILQRSPYSNMTSTVVACVRNGWI